MFTTVLSMKAMLEPRMVAASIQVLASAAQGTAALADCITASSQGVLMLTMSFFYFAPGAQGPALSTSLFFRNGPKPGHSFLTVTYQYRGRSIVAPVSKPERMALGNDHYPCGREIAHSRQRSLSWREPSQQREKILNVLPLRSPICCFQPSLL